MTADDETARGADGVDRAAIAGDLLAAYRSGEPIGRLTATYPELTVDDAYTVQLEQVDRRVEAGARVLGHKVGLTSVAMQRALGIDQPDYGHLFDDMFYAEFAEIDPDRFLQPRIEPEIGFVVGLPLGDGPVTTADVARATDHVVPVLEIIDSRIADWDIGLVDTVADNASSGAVVLGATPTSLDGTDLRLVGCNLVRNGELVATGAGGAVLGSPLTAVAWLANTLAARGVMIEPGHVVLPGSCTPAVAIEPGDTVTATFSTLGSVTATFGEGGSP